MIDFKKFGKDDPDSAKWTWDNFYKLTYEQSEYWKQLNNFKKTYTGNPYVIRYIASLPFQISGNESLEIEIGGDTMFNFKTDDPLFENAWKDKAEQEFFEGMKYSVLNFSLMPRTGNLQGNKANGNRCDRLDRFIYYLRKAIENPDSKDINPLFKVRGKNKETIEILKKYLSSFESIYKYCELYYQIKPKTVDKLIVCGEEYEEIHKNRPVNSEDELRNKKTYIILAKEVWDERYQYFWDVQGVDCKQLDSYKCENTL